MFHCNNDRLVARDVVFIQNFARIAHRIRMGCTNQIYSRLSIAIELLVCVLFNVRATKLSETSVPPTTAIHRGCTHYDTRRLPSHTPNRLCRHTVLNLHLDPVQYGVDPQYFAFAAKLGIPNATLAQLGYPAIPGPGLPPPYNTTDKYDRNAVAPLLKSSQRFGEAYLDVLDDVGMEWWWLDDEPVWTARILYERSQKLRADVSCRLCVVVYTSLCVVYTCLWLYTRVSAVHRTGV